jgi:hypothetical protein
MPSHTTLGAKVRPRDSFAGANGLGRLDIGPSDSPATTSDTQLPDYPESSGVAPLASALSLGQVFNSRFEEDSMRKFCVALVLAGLMASGTSVFSARVYAADDSGFVRPSICSVVEAAEVAVARLADGPLKTYLQNQIEAAEAKYGCN